MTTLTFKKLKILSILIVIITIFSCSKSVTDTGATKVTGTYKGTMNVFTNSTGSSNDYKEFVIKVEHSSNETVRVSCVSIPQAFDTFETGVLLANSTITSIGSQDVHLFYQTNDKTNVAFCRE